MSTAVSLILRTLDKHMRAGGKLRLLGGAALILAYGLDRSTEDADLLLDDAEAQFLAEHCNFGPALDATNRELEPLGLYVAHIWGPEQQILTPERRANCRPLAAPAGVSALTLEVLGPLDMIVSKLARCDEGDLADIRHLVLHERMPQDVVREAIERAQVPALLKESFIACRPRVEALLATLSPPS